MLAHWSPSECRIEPVDIFRMCRDKKFSKKNAKTVHCLVPRAPGLSRKSSDSCIYPVFMGGRMVHIMLLNSMSFRRILVCTWLSLFLHASRSAKPPRLPEIPAPPDSDQCKPGPVRRCRAGAVAPRTPATSCYGDVASGLANDTPTDALEHSTPELVTSGFSTTIAIERLQSSGNFPTLNAATRCKQKKIIHLEISDACCQSCKPPLK